MLNTAYNTEKYTKYPKQSICYNAYDWNTPPIKDSISLDVRRNYRSAAMLELHFFEMLFDIFG